MKRLWRALLYSLSGLRLAFRDEAAFRQEVILALLMLPAACLIASSPTELALLWGSVLLVLVVELLNSAVEAAIDRMGSEIHPLSKKAKDTASAAVLIALLQCGLVWGAIAWPVITQVLGLI